MSAKTVTAHTPTELRHEGTRAGIAIFSSASKSTGGRNFTYVDVATLEVACECQAKAGSCWHCDLGPTAYAMTTVAAFVALLSDAALEEVGRSAAATVAAGTHTVTDIAVLWQARVSHCQRARARREAAALLAALPDPALVLRRRMLPCPDCGEPARREVGLCDACFAELRATVAA